MTEKIYTDWSQVPIVLSTEEVAAVLGVHINTVKNLVKADKLPHFYVGRVLRYHKADIMRYSGLEPDDTAEIAQLRGAVSRDEEEAIPWEQAKEELKAQGVDV